MKIAVVGLGVISKTHVKALSFLGQEVSLLCDIIPERAQKVKETLAPNARVYADFHEMLEKEKPDAIEIWGSEFPYSLAAMKACPDVPCVVYVRGKNPHKQTIVRAIELGMPALSTQYTMFEACGRLYAAGLKPVEIEDLDGELILES